MHIRGEDFYPFNPTQICSCFNSKLTHLLHAEKFLAKAKLQSRKPAVCFPPKSEQILGTM